MSQNKISVVKAFMPSWEHTHGDRENKRLIGLKGGRGSGKSWDIALNRVLWQVSNPNSSGVCLREVQRSIKYSSKKLIEDVIELVGLQEYFTITQTEIKSNYGSGVIIFNGLQDHTAASIKSLEGFDWAWVEEAQTITKFSLDLLLPTIRKENSTIFFTWNPLKEDDPVEQMFRDRKKGSLVLHSTYLDNQFCPSTLKEEADELMASNYELYRHVYLGEHIRYSDSNIFAARYEVKDFEVNEKATKLRGLDYGFSVDPTAGVACYILDNCLYIHKESGGVGIEIEDTHLVVEAIQDKKTDIVYADNARPEITSHLRKKGYNVVSCKKWKGSVEDGISTIKSFRDVVIHPSCKEIAKEFSLYSYKVDRAGNVTGEVIDAYNHYIDALRYALQDYITSKSEVKVVKNRFKPF